MADLGFFQNWGTSSSLSPKIGKLKKIRQTFLLLAPLHQICQSSGVLMQFTIFSKFYFKNVRTYGKDPVNRGQLMLPSGGLYIFTTPFTTKQIKYREKCPLFVILCAQENSL